MRPWGRPRCPASGEDAPCAVPGCCVAGEQLLVVGPRSVRYLRRDRALSVQQGRLVEAWSWVEHEVVNLEARGST